MVFPLVYLGVRASEADFAALGALVFRYRTWELFRNTLVLALCVSSLSIIISLPLAWLTERSNLKGKKILTILAVLPLTIPGYVMAYALLSLGGNIGVFSQVFGVHVPRLSGLGGATLALTLYSYPYVYLNIRTALGNLDPGLEESARSFGLTGRQVFTRVILPQIGPGLLSGLAIILLYSLGDFGVVALMRYPVFSYAIYVQYSGAFNRVYAAVLSLILVVLSFGVVYGLRSFQKKRAYSRTGAGAQRRIKIYPLGGWKPISVAFLTLVFFFSLVLPAGILVFWILQLKTFETGLFVAFLGSFRASVFTALLAVLMSLPTVYLARRFVRPLTQGLETAGALGYGIPPVALGLGLVFFSLLGARFLYQTLGLLVLGYTVHFLALAQGPIRTALLQTPRKIEEAARSLGYGPVAAFFKALVPSIFRGISGAAILVFIMTMKELPLTLLLAPTGYSTLATSVFTRTSEALYAQAAPYAAAIIGFSSIFVGLIIRHEGKGNGTT
ncbi:MAG: iron ABC transporter permease [Spirochaetales bacterium]|nr:iron ABC transporter permease [Spirochaetales bacterium]